MSISRILGRHRPPGHTEDAAMYHTISYQLAQARVADLRHHAHRDTLARAARGPGRRGRPGLRPRALRRTRAVPGTARVARPAVAGDASAR